MKRMKLPKMAVWIALCFLVSGLLTGCQKEEEEPVYQLQSMLPDDSLLSFLETGQEFLSCNLEEDAYLWKLTNSETARMLSLGRFTADHEWEMAAEVPVTGYMMRGVSAASDHTLHSFLLNGDTVSWLQFDRDGTLIEEIVLDEIYQRWFQQYYFLPQLQAASRDFFYMTELVEEDKTRNVVVWGCEKGASEPSWKVSLEAASLRCAVSDGDRLLVIYERGGLDSARTVIVGVDRNGETETIWEGKDENRLDSIVTAGIQKDHLLLCDLNGLRWISLASGTQERFLSWESLQYVYSGLKYALQETEDGTITWIDNVNGQWRYVCVGQADASQTASQTRVVLAGVDIDTSVKASVSYYNMEQTAYQIEVVDYSQNGTIDFADAVMKLYTDFATGAQIDLLYTKNLDVNWLAGKGYLEDLYTCMETYGGVQRSDLDGNVLQILEKDGHLYYLFPFFQLTALAVKGAGQMQEGWSLADCLQAAEASGQEIVFHQVDPMEFLHGLLLVNQDSWLIRQESGYRIQGEAFAQLLQTMSLLDTGRKNTDLSTYTGQEIWLTEVTVDHLWRLQAYREICGEDVIFCGYPGENGGGVGMIPVSTDWELAISKTGTCKEEAWEYISYCLRKDEDAVSINTFPVMAGALDHTLEYQQTLQFNEVSGDELSYMKITVEDVWFSCYAASEREEEIFYDLLSQAVLTNELDSQMWKIIEEEAEPYLEGQKSLDEAVDIIQSRIQLLLDERG